ncbi:MAG: DUF2239 family protein, partial [Pseudomonadota bacterium]
MDTTTRRYCAFLGARQVAKGDLLSVALAARDTRDAHAGANVLLFSLEDGRQVDVLLNGNDEAIARWIDQQQPDTRAAPGHRQRGRPKLGVVGREVTLLPRQWSWLAAQPGGASVTLRKLVDEAAKRPEAVRTAARDATYRFLSAVAGDYPGYEECLRALYAGDRQAFVD